YALHDVALDTFDQPVRVDDLSAVVGDRELARPYLSGRTIDIDFGDDGNACAVTLHVSNTAARNLVAALVTARRRPRLPFRLLGCSLDPGDVARFLDVAQAELDRIGVYRGGHLVDEGFAGEVDLRADRIAQMRRA